MSAQLQLPGLEMLERITPRRKPRRPVHLPQTRQLPATRGECVRDRQFGQWPCCPYLSCRHHLFHSRAEKFDALLDKPPASWPQTCSLDVADAVALGFPGVSIPGVGAISARRGAAEKGCLRKRDVGGHLGLSGERARQLIESGLEHLAKRPVMAEIRGDVDSAVDWWGDGE